MKVEEKIKEIEAALNKVQSLAEDVVMCLDDIIPQKTVYVYKNKTAARLFYNVTSKLIKDSIKNIEESESEIEKEKWIKIGKALDDLRDLAGTL